MKIPHYMFIRGLHANSTRAIFQTTRLIGYTRLLGIAEYFDRYIDEKKFLPDCINLENEKCMSDQVRDVGTLYSKCQSQCITKEYSGRVTFIGETFLEFSHDGNKSADMIVYFGSTSRTLVQEYWVYDTPGMIGTLGGSLGLFLGFSFYGTISDLLDVIWKTTIK